MPILLHQRAANVQSAGRRLLHHHADPVDYRKEVGWDTDLGQLSVIGLFTMTLGLLVDGLLILQDDLRCVLCVSGVSLFILTVGAGLFLVGWRRGNTREIP